MAQVRVFDYEDHVVVVKFVDTPSAIDDETGEMETSEQRLERSVAIHYEKHPDHVGRHYIDIDEAELPPREKRSKWRIQNGKMVVGP